MQTLRMTALVLFYLAPPNEATSNLEQTPCALETEILRIMSGAKTADLACVAQRIEALAPEVRRALPIRVRRNTVEWRFTGTHPAERLSLQMLEYVVSSKAKDYESLLVVDDEQLQRAKRLGAALKSLRQIESKHQVEVRLAWSTSGRMRVVRLWDILSGESQRKRRQFIRQLSSYEQGLGAFNAKAAKAELPAAQVAAQIYVSVALPESPSSSPQSER